MKRIIKSLNLSRGFSPLVVILGVALVLSIGFFAYQYFQVSGPVNETPAPTLPAKKILLLTSSDLQLKSFEGLKAGMKELGYEEGKNITYDIKNPKGDRDLTKKMAQEIVGEQGDLIVPLSTTATRAILDARKTANASRPVIFVDVGNIEEFGITDVTHPGNMASGIVKDNVKIGAKRMEIMKELVPDAKKIGVMLNPKHVSFNEVKAVHVESAKTLGVELKIYEVTTDEDVDAALKQLPKDKLDGFLMVPDNLLSSSTNSKKIATTLSSNKIPSIDVNAEQGLDTGFLMTYGVYRVDVGKEGARLVAKALKGTDPGEIPIEFASSFNLEINGKLAKEIGVEVPESLKIKASRVLQ